MTTVPFSRDFLIADSAYAALWFMRNEAERRRECWCGGRYFSGFIVMRRSWADVHGLGYSVCYATRISTEEED